MSLHHPAVQSALLSTTRGSLAARDRKASHVARLGVAQLLLTSAHHAYGARVYATPWRLHVLLLSIPAMFVILAANRGVQRPEPAAAARRIFVLTTLAVPVLAIGAFEGLYNHLLKDLLFGLGAPAALLVRMFPPTWYEAPNDAFFEATGVAQAVLGAATAWCLLRPPRSPAASDVRRAPAVVSRRVLTSIDGRPAEIPCRARLLHLQFRRFAGCPVCSLHLRTFVRRHRELEAANVEEIVVFHSTAEELRRHAACLPFAVVPDPDKRLYAEFGVEASPRAVLDPRAWAAIARGVWRSLVASLRGREPLPALRPRGGRFGLPADLLVAPDGRVVAAKYGSHADDQWSVDEVLGMARDAELK